MPSTRTIASGGTATGTTYADLTITQVRSGEEPDVVQLDTMKFTASPCIDRVVDLSSTGDNTLTLNASTRAVFLVPPSGNATAWKPIASGDTGIAAVVNGIGLVLLSSTTASIIINTGAAISNFRVLEA